MAGTVKKSPSSDFYTLEEYLQFDDQTPGKHEYYDGRIITLENEVSEALAMAGGSPNHARISANLIREAGNRLVGKPCEAFGSDLRVAVPNKPSFSYPDLTVVCGKLEFDPREKKPKSVINPRVIGEVLSPGTEREDRGLKFRRYLQLQSLREYLLISQEEPRVESFLRNEDGSWLFSFVEGLEKILQLRSLEIEIPMREVYRNVVFAPAQ